MLKRDMFILNRINCHLTLFDSSFANTHLH